MFARKPICCECGKPAWIAWAKRGWRLVFVCERCYVRLGYGEYCIAPGVKEEP